VTLPLALGLLVAVAGQAGPAPAPAGGPRTPAVVRPFEALWADYVAADARGDAVAEAQAMREIRRARMERNVDSLGAVGLALVAHGFAKQRAGEGEEAEQELRAAVALAPGLPDAHQALASALLKQGPFGVVASLDASSKGLTAFVATERGARRARDLLTLAALVAAFASGWAIAIALLVRRGGLLLHDIEEWLGPAHHRSASLALFLLLLLLPVATFQGWGWLPLWWLALVFSYLDVRERGLAFAIAACTIAIGPAVVLLEERLRTARNPLYQAALAAVESVPGPGAIAELERALAQDPGDRDLVSLVGAARKKTGRYDEAAELYRQALAADPQDEIARNNLANIEFVRGSYDAASGRYRAGTGSAQKAVAATSFYNLSLAHLQRFEYQAYGAAKSSADRLAPGLVADYDRFKFDTGDYAVVDLGLDGEQVFRKFAGAEAGVAVRNVLRGEAAAPSALSPAALVNRFAAALAAFGLAAFLVSRWRGRKAVTRHCRRCGTAFCRLCQLGQVSGELCSQCYHLFVVRDGVSAPVRNRKLAEVQANDARRERLTRALSLVSPGAGQVYGGWALRGAALVAAWYAVVGLVAASRVVAFAEVPSVLRPPWAEVAAVVALAVLWGVAFRFRPGPELELKHGGPQARGGPGKPRARPQAGAA
jgi:Flp pilus assembly protein TadD